MKKITLTFTIFLIFKSLAFTQTLDWAKSMGSGGWEVGYAIAVDALGNVYTTGYFEDTVDFDPNTGINNLSAVGDKDVFIQKLNAEGNLLWVKNIGSSEEDVGRGLAVDELGNVYITGWFRETVDFDPNAGISNLTANGYFDIFVQKLDTDGNFIWAKNIGGNGRDEGYSIAVDDYGNVYTTGYFVGTVDFDPSLDDYILTSDGDDIFIQKLDSEGNLIWAKSMGGPEGDIGYSIEVDDLGNVYTTGIFEGTVDFDPNMGIYTLSSEGSYDFFVQKLDSEGSLIWVKSVGGLEFDGAQSIALDISGNIYTTGYFEGTVDFDPSLGTYNLTGNGADIFIQKLDSEGNFVWAKKMGGQGHDFGFSLAVDDLGAVYTTGRFDLNADFNPNSGENILTSEGFSDIFIQKLDSEGNFVWAKKMGGTKGDIGYSIEVDDLGKIYTTGYFKGTVDFDPNAGVMELTAFWDQDIFIQKLNAEGSVETENRQSFKVEIYPNPVDDFLLIENIETFNFSQLKILNSIGFEIISMSIPSTSLQIDMSTYQNGLYYVILSGDYGELLSRKFLKIH